MKDITKILETLTAETRFNKYDMVLVITQEEKTGDCVAHFQEDQSSIHSHFSFIGAIESAKTRLIIGPSARIEAGDKE
tara:strand:+ start:353 stop:586 length:234 start_codon:yes stop_codon:yes gene_type:complete